MLLCVLWVGRRRRVGKAIVISAALAVACLSLYVYLPLRASQDPAIAWTQTDSLDGFLYHVTAVQYASRLFAAPAVEVAHNAREFIAQLPLELPWVLLALAAAGLCALWRSARVVLGALALEALLVFFHAINYKIPDIESYYIPIYGVLAVFSGVGVFWLVTRAARGRWLRAVALVAVLLIACLAIGAQVTGDWSERDLSERNETARFVDRLLGTLDRGAILLARNDRTIFPLWYVRFVEGRRGDVAIVDLPARTRALDNWFPGLKLPTREVIEACLARSQAQHDYPPGRERLLLEDYVPLLVSLNGGDRPIYADVSLAVKTLPHRAVPAGLVVEIVGDTLAAMPTAGALLGRPPWSEYLSGLAAAPHVGGEAARAYARTLAGYGRLYLARGDVGSAVATLEEATDLAPDLVGIQNNLGVAYVRAGRSDDGLLEFERALELSPGTASIRYNRSEVYAALGDPARAELELLAAEKLDPHNARYKIKLAELYERRGDLDTAEGWFDAAERFAPLDWGIKVTHGDFLARHRRYADAVAAYRRAEELNPFSPGIHRHLGRCYWMLERPDNAVAAIRRSVELQPHNPGLKHDLAIMLWKSEKSPEALTLLDDAIRLLPTSPRAYAAKAAMLGEMERYEESRVLFEKARDLGADGSSFWEAWISMEAASGETAAARASGSERP
jgi:Flp pilus assembly protein TadD